MVRKFYIRVNYFFIYVYKKAIGPVVATTLLLVVSVVAVTGFSSWFQTFSSSTFSDVETQSGIDSTLRVEGLIGDILYLKSGKDTNLLLLKVFDDSGNEMCSFSSISKIRENDLVGWWNFDEGVGNISYDKSINGLNGKITKHDMWSNDSISGYSLKFGGQGSTDFVMLGTDPKLNPSTFTITAWAKLNVLGTYNMIYSNTGDCCGSHKGIEFREYIGNELYGNLKDGGVSTLLGGPLPNLEWIFLVYTFNGTHQKLYKGLNQTYSRVSSYSRSGTPASSPTAIGSIGTSNSSNVYTLNGYLDEIRLYNSSLSNEEIRNIYWYSKNKIYHGINEIDLSSCNLNKGNKYNIVTFTNSQKVEHSLIAK